MAAAAAGMAAASYFHHHSAAAAAANKHHHLTAELTSRGSIYWPGLPALVSNPIAWRERISNSEFFILNLFKSKSKLNLYTFLLLSSITVELVEMFFVQIALQTLLLYQNLELKRK